ncbi:HEC/Ndc80p family-domain-containing protein [Cristinia sonorae]|uniref:Kinetochore protein NDC80 n=1 Tax=Cristinia sonorae TaxID=1940300 RepID=A0A8K0XUG5_9AGAR|nr:HEC/Ndc80p family-domain-containing protein [Cristinia sonorae]
MADFRRRSTAQPAVDPYGNPRQLSGLPVPSTIKKPTQNTGRMSISGPAMRGPLLQPPSTVQRNSVLRSQNNNPLLMSASKPGFGRTPMHSSVRRGSMWIGGSQGSAPSSSQPLKDPRNIRDRNFQAKMRQDIVGWLQATEFDIPNSVLQNITGRDFGAIFKHLVSLLDPQWPFRSDQRWEEQFLPPLKALRYPFVGAIDPRWLATPAAPHSWPTLLGVLHWLVEMGKARLQYMESEHPTLQDALLVPDEFDDEHHHRALAMSHYLAAYEVFLHGQDMYPEQEKALEERYALKDSRVVADLEQKKEQLNTANAELQQLLESPAPIEALRKKNGEVKHDRAKFEEYMRVAELRKEDYINYIKQEKAELAQTLTMIGQLRAEEARLTDVVKVQNLSPEEVHRMNSEHEGLSRDLETLKHKIAETSKTALKLEVSLTKKVADAEDAVDAYTNLLATLGLFPPLPPPLQDVKLTLALNTAAPNPPDILVGPGIREVVKPSLAIIAELKRTERADVESERIKVDNELDQLTTEWENIQEEVNEVLNKVTALNDEAEELREVAQQEALVSNAEASHLERELAQARTSAMANGVGVKSRLQAVQIAYREQIDKVERLRDETVRAIIKNSSDIVSFKEEVSTQLKDLRDFADGN